MATPSGISRVGPGVYLVEAENGRREIVYVAASGSDRWAFWNGQTFRFVPDVSERPRTAASAHAAQPLASPMPATVVKVLVAPGSRVTKGTVVVILEAMKMELPIRSTSDATIKAVLCREGDLVEAGQVLIEQE